MISATMMLSKKNIGKGQARVEPPDKIEEIDANRRAVLVFSALVVKRLITDSVRLPPTYIGVRRVRPSNEAHSELRSKNSSEPTSVVYKKTNANGIERRMNSQEKKELKQRLKKEKAIATRQKNKQELSADKGKSEVSSLQSASRESTSKYYQIKVSSSSLEEELADLRGDRDGVPPVMLSPPMAQEAFRIGLLQTDVSSRGSFSDMPNAVLDHELAERWAIALKSNMKAAEEGRRKEAMRPMPYQLLPEAWIRLRPESLSAGTLLSTANEASVVKRGVEGENDEDAFGIARSGDWCSIAAHRRWQPVDDDTAIIYSLLRNHGKLHVSCGAKFGCDFLIYDGRRDQRHAFAGLRIVESTSTQLPMVSAYDLAGYVRGVNTAGKLALLATVKHDESGTRVAIVDLALERDLTVTSRARERSKGKKRTRKEVGKNLAKK